jgi:hypothetical protein
MSAGTTILSWMEDRCLATFGSLKNDVAYIYQENTYGRGNPVQ